MPTDTEYVTGIDEFCLYAADPSETNPGTTLGTVIGGVMTTASEVQEVRSIGNYEPESLREGLFRGYGSVDIYPEDHDDSHAVLETYLERTGAPARLADFAIQGGGHDEAQIHNYAKIDSAIIELAAGSPVRISLNWKALTGSRRTTALKTHADFNQPIMMWYEGSYSSDIGTVSALKIIGATININHNVDWQPMIDNTGVKRAAKYLVEKAQVVTCTLRVLKLEAYDLASDGIANIGNLTFAIVGTTRTLTITLTDLRRGTFERPLTPSELIEHGILYNVRAFNISRSAS